MPDRRPTLMQPRIEELLDRTGIRFTLVTLAAQRARQINSYFNRLGEGLGTIVPPQVNAISRKPLSISLQEIAESKIVAEPVEPEEGEAGAEASESGDEA